jgi:hypothetical protein
MVDRKTQAGKDKLAEDSEANTLMVRINYLHQESELYQQI